MARKDWRVAADGLRAVLEGGKLSGDDLDRARFLLGRLLVAAKDDDGAEGAYALVTDASPLAPYAHVRRAALLAKKGKGVEALALLETVKDIEPLENDRRVALGEALAQKGDHAGAAAAFEGARKGGRWVEASIRHAEEVVAAADAAQALEAAKGARRVRFEVPGSSLVPRAEDAEQKCKALLATKDQKAAATLGSPTPAEEITAGIAYVDGGKPKDALPLLEKALNALSGKKDKGKELWCKGELALARVHEKTKQKPKAIDVYGDIAAACTDEGSKITALYDSAKLAAGKQPGVARIRFAEIEKLFPKHRLADDARFRGALIAIEQGETDKGEKMLGSLPDDYPDGDMKAEALFRLALPRMKEGKWKEAVPFLERSLSLVPHEDGYFVAGRASYFLGRAELETGKVKEGLERLGRVVGSEPLSFASAMAYARVAARGGEDAKSIKASLENATGAEVPGALYPNDRAELTTPGFLRAVELARVGEIEPARKELSSLGLLKDANKDPDGQWIAAALFAAVGEARAAHNFPRGKVTEWQHHFPSGKWRQAWELAYPRPWADSVSAASAAEGVPAAVIWAVMREESAFEPDVVSHADAYGLLQLILPTAAAYAKPLKLQSDAKSLTQPEINIPIGTAFLHKLRNDFAQNPALAIPSYNAGEGATRRWMNPPLADSFDLWCESIPYEETRKYTKRVLTSYYAYVALYDAAHLDGELKAATGKP